jgi:hypothetical protein
MEICVAEIGPTQFEKATVWEYFDAPGTAEVMVRDVRATPVTDLYGRVVAVRGQLACGASNWLALTGLDRDPILCRMTRQVYLYNEQGRKLKITALPGDFDSVVKQIESFIGIDIISVFPITYDLAGVVESEETKGVIVLEDAFADRDPLVVARIAALAELRSAVSYISSKPH